MSDDYSQIQRQFQILRILAEHPQGLDVGSIHNRLKSYGYDVTDRTVRRDIDSLSHDFPISENNQVRPKVFILLSTDLKNINLSFDELQAIKFIEELAKSYRHLDVGANAEKILNKLLESLPEGQKYWLQNASSLLKVNISDFINEPNSNPEIRNIIREAILTKKCLKIEYYSFHNDTILTRTIEPYLIEINEGCYHLIAYCHVKNAMRDFRVSRILSAEITSKEFNVKKDLLEKFRNNRFQSMSGQETRLLKLRFSGTSARLVKEFYSKLADKLEDGKDGSILFERNVAITPEIKRWILGFGSEVEVLEPAELREDIRKMAFKMLSVYKK